MLNFLVVICCIHALTSVSEAAPTCYVVDDLNTAIRCWDELKIESYDKCISEKGNSDDADAECFAKARDIANATFIQMQENVIRNGITTVFKSLHNRNYFSTR